MPSGEVPELKAGVVVIMGSRSDLDQAERVAAALGELGVSAEPRIASAHKTIHHLLQLMQEYEATYDRLVYVTIAGRANALSAVVDANTRFPVIAAPPIAADFAGMDLLSSLRLPSGVAPGTVLGAEAAALLAAKMLALGDQDLAERVGAYQRRMAHLVETDDEQLRARTGA